MTHQRSHPHESEGHLKYHTHGLSPYWTLSKLLFDRFDGYGEVDTEFQGGPWHVELAYSDCGIAVRDADPLGRETFREFEIHCEGPGEAKCHFNVSPRFERMESPDGEALSIPWEPAGEGVDVDFHASNIEPDAVPDLLHLATQALAGATSARVRRDYLAPETLDGSISNLYTYERYVRIKREPALKLVRSSGLFGRIHQLLASQTGSTWEYHGDNTDVIGQLHRLVLDPRAASELIPVHSRGKQLKHYHPKHVRADPDGDDPLAHPKFGVLLKQGMNGGEAFAWGARGELRREIEETIVNCLTWADVPARPDPTTFVADDHFNVGDSDVEVARFEDPTPEIEAEQESILVRALDDLTPAAEDVGTALADGGRHHVRELAAETESALSTIYRALEQLGALVENDHGTVDFSSEKLRQEVQGIVAQTGGHLRTNAERAARLVHQGTRRAASSALQQWLTTYAASIVQTETGDRKLRVDTVLSALQSEDLPHVAEVFREGLEAWTAAGRDPATFLQMRFEAEVSHGPDSARVRTVL